MEDVSKVINTTFPLWTVILSVLFAIGSGVWSLISMYFKGIAMDKRIGNLEAKFNQELIKFEQDLKAHKEETHKDIERINRKLDNMNNVLIETNTYCKLLLGDKIK